MNNNLQGAFKRWEMTSFGDERPSTLAARIKEKEEEENRARAAAANAAAARVQQFAAGQAAPPPPAVQLPTAAELDAIREQARAEGYAEGLEEDVLLAVTGRVQQCAARVEMQRQQCGHGGSSSCAGPGEVGSTRTIEPRGDCENRAGAEG